MQDEITDQEYYAEVQQKLNEAGFDDRPLDFETVMEDKRAGKTVEESAQAFIDDWS